MNSLGAVEGAEGHGDLQEVVVEQEEAVFQGPEPPGELHLPLSATSSGASPGGLALDLDGSPLDVSSRLCPGRWA